MNLITLLFTIVLFCMGGGWSVLNAAKIDGQTSVVIKSSSHNFDGDDPGTGTSPLDGVGALGAVWFQNGFTLYDDPSPADTQISIVFPVNGTITMNGGTLKLLHDLTLGSDVLLSGTGSLKGEGNVLKLSNDLTYDTNTLTVATSIILDGANHQFVLAAGGTLSVGASQTLTLKNMDFVWLGTLSMGAGSTLVLDNVRMHMNSDETLSNCSVIVKNESEIHGANGSSNTVLTYTSDATVGRSFSISADSMLSLSDGVTVKYGGTEVDRFVFTDATSRLTLVGATLETTVANTDLKKGVIWADNHSYILGSGSGNFDLGGSGTDDLDLKIMAGATIDFSGGSNDYLNTQ